MRALFIQPHNDDAVIALGGVMQKLCRHGHELTYLYLTDGRHGSDTVPPEKLAEIRLKEAGEERALLGIKEYFDLGIEDGTLARLGSVRRRWLEEQFEGVLAKVGPDVILIPSRADMHPDHRAAHDLASGIAPGGAAGPLVVKYAVWLFPDFFEKPADPADQVIMAGVDAEMPGKISAIRAHRSQISRGSFDSMAQFLGAYLAHSFRAPATIGCRYVEILGLYQPHLHRRTVNDLIRALEPCADITTVLHGRLSQNIRA